MFCIDEVIEHFMRKVLVDKLSLVIITRLHMDDVTNKELEVG